MRKLNILSKETAVSHVHTHIVKFVYNYMLLLCLDLGKACLSLVCTRNLLASFLSYSYMAVFRTLGDKSCNKLHEVYEHEFLEFPPIWTFYNESLDFYCLILDAMYKVLQDPNLAKINIVSISVLYCHVHSCKRSLKQCWNAIWLLKNWKPAS